MRQPGAGRGRVLILQFVFLMFMLLCGCGALFFAYQIFDTVRQAVLVMGTPNLGDINPLVITPGTPSAPTPSAGSSDRVNVLILGIDRRPSEKCPCRSDTMMLATLDTKNMTAGLVTIPRDLYIEIPQVNRQDRINTANLYGELYKYPGGGPALAKKTVEYNLGRRVNYYVLVDFTGFRKAIDALGGIDVNVPKVIDDPTYPDENFGFKPIHIPAGLVHMNGEMALQYARTRHGDSDFGRAKRQMQVLMAARDKALRLDIITKLPALLQSMWGIVETDMSPKDVIALAQVAAKVKTENIKQASIDDTMTVEYKTEAGADVLWPDRSKIGRLMDQIIPQDNGGLVDQAKRIQQEGARVLVLNGTSNAQVAKNTADYLQTQGYQIAGFGNADRFDYAQTVLIDYSGTKNATVTALAKAFSIAPDNMRPTRNVKSDVDIRLIIGADWKLPNDKAQP